MILSIIIPVFNEKKTIKEILKRVLSVKLPPLVKKEIIVIDDGSTDRTGVEIRSTKGIKKIFHKKNLGKGVAVRNGLKSASGDIIIIQDADLEYDPNYYPTLLKPILENNAKVVYGTRLINYPLRLWGQQKTILPSHLIANKLLTVLINILYGTKLTDMETCYKVFKKEVLKDISLTSEKFDIEPEITIKFIKAGFHIVEVPIKVNPRTYQEGKKIGFIDGIEAIWTILKYRFTN